MGTIERVQDFAWAALSATVGKDFRTEDYQWFKYKATRGTKLTNTKGTTTLRSGDLFGVKEFNSKSDKILVLKEPNLIFQLSIAASDKIVGEKADHHKGRAPKLPAPAEPKAEKKTAAPAKPGKNATQAEIRKYAAAQRKRKRDTESEESDLGRISDAILKTAKIKAKPEKIHVEIPPVKPKAVKPKITLTQKKIAETKAAITALKALTQNASNVRKLAKLQDELKALRLKDKTAQARKQPAATPEPVAKPVQPDSKPTAPKHVVRKRKETKPVNPEKEVEKIDKKKAEQEPKVPPVKFSNIKLPSEFETARDLLRAIDKGGVPLNTAKLNSVGRDLGLDISKNAEPADTIKRIQAAVQRAIESAQAQATKPPEKKQTRTRHDDDDEDGEDLPHGSIRFGGKILDPGELEFDDDISGLNLHIDESWSATATANINRKPMYCIASPDFDYQQCGQVNAISSLDVARQSLEKGLAIFQLLLNPSRLFDMREEQCQNDYNGIRETHVELPDMESNDFCCQETGIPRGAFVSQLRDPLAEMQYDSILTTESKEYNSISVLKPSAVESCIKLNFS